MIRPDIDKYFLSIARVVATRSTCLRHSVGAVGVKNKHILATGYNGAPARLKDCLELGCLRDKLGIASGDRTEICRGVHAEENVIIQASLFGVSLIGSTIYCTHSPCRRCAKMLINAQIERFVSLERYSDNEFQDLFEEAGIKFEVRE